MSPNILRSEEHTSELQSRPHIVCRLLLEKKKRAMGVPIAPLIIGSNRTDILTRFFASGRMAIEAVHPSLSPSMDIQVFFNVERLPLNLTLFPYPALSR